MKHLTIGILVFVISAIVLISGCTQQAPKVGEVPGAPQQPAVPGVATSAKFDVSIANFAFNPQNITIKAGTTVVWKNKDSVTHDVTIDNGLFDHDINPGEEFAYTFDKAGTYNYHCDIHTSMKGTIIVESD